MNLDNPKTFIEKLQWLKIYDRKPEYIMVVDKYEVKRYVVKIIGEEYIIPTLGIWNSFEKVGFDKLPNQFVLKCTYNSGGLVICHDKSKFDFESAKKQIVTCLMNLLKRIEKEANQSAILYILLRYFNKITKKVGILICQG